MCLLTRRTVENSTPHSEHARVVQKRGGGGGGGYAVLLSDTGI